VREHRPLDDVADGVNALDRGFEKLIDLDTAAIIFAPAFALVTFDPVLKIMPCFLKIFSASLRISPSMPGRI
jgi:hypothetical protein